MSFPDFTPLFLVVKDRVSLSNISILMVSVFFNDLRFWKLLSACCLLGAISFHMLFPVPSDHREVNLKSMILEDTVLALLRPQACG